MPDATASYAAVVAQQAQSTLGEADETGVSIGACEIPSPAATPEALIATAYPNLYQAKENGGLCAFESGETIH